MGTAATVIPLWLALATLVVHSDAMPRIPTVLSQPYVAVPYYHPAESQTVVVANEADRIYLAASVTKQFDSHTIDGDNGLLMQLDPDLTVQGSRFANCSGKVHVNSMFPLSDTVYYGGSFLCTSDFVYTRPEEDFTKFLTPTPPRPTAPGVPIETPFLIGYNFASPPKLTVGFSLGGAGGRVTSVAHADDRLYVVGFYNYGQFQYSPGMWAPPLGSLSSGFLLRMRFGSFDVEAARFCSGQSAQTSCLLTHVVPAHGGRGVMVAGTFVGTMTFFNEPLLVPGTGGSSSAHAAFAILRDLAVEGSVRVLPSPRGPVLPATFASLVPIPKGTLSSMYDIYVITGSISGDLDFTIGGISAGATKSVRQTKRDALIIAIRDTPGLEADRLEIDHTIVMGDPDDLAAPDARVVAACPIDGGYLVGATLWTRAAALSLPPEHPRATTAQTGGPLVLAKFSPGGTVMDVIRYGTSAAPVPPADEQPAVLSCVYDAPTGDSIIAARTYGKTRLGSYDVDAAEGAIVVMRVREITVTHSSSGTSLPSRTHSRTHSRTPTPSASPARTPTHSTRSTTYVITESPSVRAPTVTVTYTPPVATPPTATPRSQTPSPTGLSLDDIIPPLSGVAANAVKASLPVALVAPTALGAAVFMSAAAAACNDHSEDSFAEHILKELQRMREEKFAIHKPYFGIITSRWAPADIADRYTAAFVLYDLLLLTISLLATAAIIRAALNLVLRIPILEPLRNRLTYVPIFHFPHLEVQIVWMLLPTVGGAAMMSLTVHSFNTDTPIIISAIPWIVLFCVDVLYVGLMVVIVVTLASYPPYHYHHYSAPTPYETQRSNYIDYFTMPALTEVLNSSPVSGGGAATGLPSQAPVTKARVAASPVQSVLASVFTIISPPLWFKTFLIIGRPRGTWNVFTTTFSRFGPTFSTLMHRGRMYLIIHHLCQVAVLQLIGCDYLDCYALMPACLAVMIFNTGILIYRGHFNRYGESMAYVCVILSTGFLALWFTCKSFNIPFPFTNSTAVDVSSYFMIAYMVIKVYCILAAIAYSSTLLCGNKAFRANQIVFEELNQAKNAAKGQKGISSPRNSGDEPRASAHPAGRAGSPARPRAPGEPRGRSWMLPEDEDNAESMTDHPRSVDLRRVYGISGSRGALSSDVPSGSGNRSHPSQTQLVSASSMTSQYDPDGWIGIDQKLPAVEHSRGAPGVPAYLRSSQLFKPPSPHGSLRSSMFRPPSPMNSLRPPAFKVPYASPAVGTSSPRAGSPMRPRAPLLPYETGFGSDEVGVIRATDIIHDDDDDSFVGVPVPNHTPLLPSATAPAIDGWTWMGGDASQPSMPARQQSPSR